MDRNKCPHSTVLKIQHCYLYATLQRPFAKGKSSSEPFDSMTSDGMHRGATITAYVKSYVSFISGAKCERVGGRAGDSGGHGRPRTLHPRQRDSLDEGPCTTQLEQPDLHPIS